MNKLVDIIKNIYNIKELRDRILFTLGLLLVYRLGAQVVLPGVDSLALSDLSTRSDGGGLLGILNAFTGGAFANASIFALGIMPYISAAIVVQLMGVALPYLQKLQKEGESGRKKITQITRWLTIFICVVQAPAYLYGLSALGVPDSAFIFGRTPMFQGKGGAGRDHHMKGFSMWLAGGGIKGGTTYGATDELGYNSVDNIVHIRDLHATMLHLMGIDHKKFTYQYQGLDTRLTGVEQAKVVKEIIL